VTPSLSANDHKKRQYSGKKRRLAMREHELVRFDQTDDSWARIGDVWTRCIFMGPENSPAAPVGLAIKAGPDVGDLIAGKRSFDTTTVLTVLSGRVMHDGRWLEKGDMYVAPPGDVNGDLLFGPDGGMIFLMFDKRSGLTPRFADEGDQANFDRELRKDVEAVASGKVEKSVSILPLRTTPMPGRAIAFWTVEEVAEYRKMTGGEW
jgi:hypothetical protein